MSKDDPKAHLSEAYTRMIERARTTAEDAGKRLELAVDEARDMAHELGELTRDEAELLAEYVKRDLQDLGAYLGSTGHDLRGWFVMDKTLVEARLFELMTSVADKTNLALAEFSRNLHEPAVWRTGEITGPGVLACLDCGKTLQLAKPGRIPPCPHCSATRFRRQHGLPSD
ncbi:hypothetical protein BI364_12260 [Acidihalobacter yilgarnensis]|uniref:Zinc ribbon-containing protein n=1 Tax=Acidihalobacter yilgarnensis TaxID=2819280 RepID=A0A1D8IQ42_9GAMM|nr:zinc ribbon-containing protein [Acidihalobacter yilgarnensis]AOU98628.1 hypothetical protein BI364_12260 [Acidihalobacter yilgarnensis]